MNEEKNAKKGEKREKEVLVILTIPNLPAAHAQPTGRGKGSSFRVALTRAIEAALSTDHVKGHRITGLTIKAQLIEPVPGLTDE